MDGERKFAELHLYKVTCFSKGTRKDLKFLRWLAQRLYWWGPLQGSCETHCKKRPAR